MKRMFTLILCLIILPVSCFALSASDLPELLQKLSALDLSELHTVNSAIQKLIFENTASIDGVIVPPGVYTVGEDIPAGSYRITFEPKVSFSSSIFQHYNTSGQLAFTGTFGASGSDTIGKITLHVGDTVQITLGDLRFFTYTGLFL